MYEELLIGLRGHAKLKGCDDRCPCYDAKSRGYATCSEELAEKAADAIEELSKFRWILVTEKNHPKAYEPVMVIYIGCHDALPHRDCTAYWSEDEGLWRWAETNDKVNVTITHYVPLPPLPEPPKEEIL